MTGMASLVEFQDFQLNLPHHPVAMMPTIPEMQTLEEIMAQDVEPLPTPPLSPDHVCAASPSSESSNDVDSAVDSMDITEALLNEMMQYEQLFADDDETAFGGGNGGHSTFSLEGNFLVQDCWWNSHTYKPRNTINIGTNGLCTPMAHAAAAINVGTIGLYTPASTPPPQVEEDQDQADLDDEAPTPKNDTSSESSSGDQTDGISPTDMFPACLLTPKDEEEEEEEEEENRTKKAKLQPTRHTRQERTRRAIEREQRSSQRERRTTIMTRRSSANTSSNARIQPQASASSESEEEIDVVTVSDRPERTVTRGGGSSRRRSGSASAPCSRQGSPTPVLSRTKKRRHHVKRLRRLSSAGNEDITESDDEQRRASHNILERKRRNDLKYSFQLLREQVPELEDNQRAPKVIILRKAAEFIKEIHVREERLEEEYEKEKKREAELLQRLAYLKSLPLTAGLLGEAIN